MRHIRISAGGVAVEASLDESATADAVWQALPIKGSANVWGEEIYFEVPIALNRAPDARSVVELGTVAFWPPGSALCLFFGRTPASRGDEIRAASPVNVFGRIEGDATLLKRVRDREPVSVERL